LAKSPDTLIDGLSSPAYLICHPHSAVAFIFTVLVCVASSVSIASDVCILSTHQTKINTFTQKDVEVSQNSRFANENAGKKDCGFFG
jgi:hypothetical protein